MLSQKRFPIAHNWISDLIVLSLFLFVFYLAWLGTYPFFTPDEGRYSEVAREMIASGDYITPRVNGVAFLDKPVLYYWLQTFAMHLFGVNEWAIRFFPALFGITGCLMTYLGGRFLFDRRTGWLSALILATTPLYFGGAHYADLNLEVAVLISSCLICFIIGIQRHDRYRFYFLITAYFLSACAFLTKGMIGVAFPALIGGTWIMLLSRWKDLLKIYLPLGIALFIALVLPWYLLVQKANPAFLHYFFVTQQVTRFLSADVFNNRSPVWFYAPVILLGFFPWTIFLFQSLNQFVRLVWQNREKHATELFLLLWLSIIFIFFSIPKSKTVGYIFPVFPVLALLVGRYISLQWSEKQGSGLKLTTLAFMALNFIVGTLLLLLPHYEWLPMSPQFTPHLKAAAACYFLTSLASVLVFSRKKISTLLLIGILSSFLSLLTLMSGASYVNHDSAKPLTTVLKKVLQPEDEVVNYFRFYQDIPLYLGKRVTLVANWDPKVIAQKDNWQRELWYGMAFQKTDDWLIDEDQFWQRFESKRRVFVFVGTNYFDQFKQRAKHYFFLAQHNDIILLSNQPFDLTEHP